MSADEARDEVARLVALHRLADRDGRTPLLRKLAKALVDARIEHFTSGGRPDLAGSSWAYRRFVNAAFRQAGLSGPEASAVQSAVRYHVSNEVRARFEPGALEGYGYKPEGQRDRAREYRRRRAELMQELLAAAGKRDNDKQEEQ